MTERAAIVVAAGSSSRFGGDKMMTEVAGRPLVVHSVEALVDHVDICVLVCRQDQLMTLASLALGASVVPGGSTRTESEMSGLAALGGDARLIGIHDGARPLVSDDLIETLFSTAAKVGGAVPVIEPDMPVLGRESLRPVDAVVAQTPQVFHGEVLFGAYVKAAQEGFSGHDTADVVQRYSDIEIAAVPGDPGNIKVTHLADLDLVRSGLEDPSHTEPV
jgi:2-C-methyl-D-erythritol 4-phosphate cytidylyltransferase